ncbi:glycerophosphodiester phosphodiesterase family protein [Actinopolymorpha sp. B11F2]|uniref:glycerophosphodiester phosphodiesterase n=1 Tax=Actinopolymorpha sp. B11F2 TaxID=3160862 RepID=UPI0032E4D041
MIAAHRGASGDAPENTSAAFEEALAQGADVIELDVRRTADGELVVFHDANLRRTTDATRVFPDRAPWRVRDFTLAELRRLDAGGWNDERFAGQRIPTLDETIDLVGDRARLLIEMKRPSQDEGMVAAVAACLDRHGRGGPLEASGDSGRFVVASIEREYAFRYKELRPEVTVAALTVRADTDLAELERIAQYAAFIGTGQARFPPEQVERVQALGLGVLTNTSTAADVREMMPLGIDGVITDHPGRMVTALREERAVWIEVESLEPGCRSSCPVEVQPNKGMNGGKWSGDAQLLVRATGPGDTAEVAFDTSGLGSRNLGLTLGGSPAGGIHQLSLDGEPLGPPVDTYRGSVARQTLTFPHLVLAEGAHVLHALVTGRHSSSTGFDLGLDVLELRAAVAR